MLHILTNKRGITIVEMIVAVLLTSVGVVSILVLQSTSWKTVAKADYLGRATGILYGELEKRQAIIMNPSKGVTDTAYEDDVWASGQANGVEGDALYHIKTTVAGLGTGTNAWRVTVLVTWPPLNSKGITESMIVTKQDRFNFE